ncbi:MAG: HEPN domain-containing protein [Acidobacteriota bacterium]|nr:HEPN domain-containing protein [Acidobacteriota bacterium]
MGEDVVKNWLALARYDIETAKAMLDAGRYLYVAFTCQQAVEKTLKAIIVRHRKQAPPHTHNLLRLVEEVKDRLDADSRRLETLEKLNAYYIESRYSEEYAELTRLIGKKEAAGLYRDTLKILEWLRACTT